MIITLWIVTILGIFAVAIARYLSREIRLSKYYKARIEAEALARSGVMMFVSKLMLDDTEHDWLGDDWKTGWVLPATMEGKSLTILTDTISDEESRINLNNTAMATFIVQLLTNHQITQPQVIVNGIMSHIDGTAIADPPYFPKGAPLVSHEELWELPVIVAQPEAYPILEQYTTTAMPADIDTVNINTADYEVLRGITGVSLSIDEGSVPSESVLQPLVTARSGIDGEFTFDPTDDCFVTQEEMDAGAAVTKLSDCTGGANQTAFTTLLSLSNVTFVVKSTLFRFEVLAELENPPVKYRAEAVVYRPKDSGDGDPEIVSWKEL